MLHLFSLFDSQCQIDDGVILTHIYTNTCLFQTTGDRIKYLHIQSGPSLQSAGSRAVAQQHPSL